MKIWSFRSLMLCVCIATLYACHKGQRTRTVYAEIERPVEGLSVAERIQKVGPIGDLEVFGYRYKVDRFDSYQSVASGKYVLFIQMTTAENDREPKTDTASIARTIAEKYGLDQAGIKVRSSADFGSPTP